MKHGILGFLAYLLPTFPLGYFWHLSIFADRYRALNVYRENPIIPLGLSSMILQGILWSFLYGRLFAGEPVLSGALKFACIATPLAWSFTVLAVAAKSPMTSTGEFVALETGFNLLQYAVVSPLIALAYRNA